MNFCTTKYRQVINQTGVLNPQEKRTAVLVSQPGITHNTLRSMLASLPCVHVLDAAGALSGYDLLEHEPIDAVVIDSNVPQAETLALLKHIKQESPRTRCIVLTTTNRNHNQLLTIGVDVLFLQNCSLRELETAVCHLEPTSQSK